MKKSKHSEKEIITEIIREHSASISQACRLMVIYRFYFYYIEKKDDYQVSMAIKEASEFGVGFRKIYFRIRRSGKNGITRKYTVYINRCAITRAKLKKQLPARVKNPLMTSPTTKP